MRMAIFEIEFEDVAFNDVGKEKKRPDN